MKNKKYLLFLLLIPIIIIIGRSFALPINSEVKTIELQSDNYNNPGSYNIKKNIEWIERGKAELTIEVNTKEKNEKETFKDIVLVVDTSSSMNGDKLRKVKNDIIELIDNLTGNLMNRIALIQFDDEASIKSNFTNNKEELISIINSFSSRSVSNYSKALLKVGDLLFRYDKESNRELVVLFLTDGISNLDTPNEKALYQVLKDDYPYIHINAIQYDLEKDVSNTLISMSDNQFVATDNNVLFEAILNSIPYEKLVIEDIINSEYFYVESIDNIDCEVGNCELINNNSEQRIKWELNNILTGTSNKLKVIVNLKESLLNQGGLYQVNRGTIVNSKLSNENEIRLASDNSLILKNNYIVKYNMNLPSDCNLESIATENHYVGDVVNKKTSSYYCDGYVVKSWVINNSDNNTVKEINDTTFVMPGHDVTIIPVWTKQSVVKNMDGIVYAKANTLYRVLQDAAIEGTYAREYIGPHQDSNTKEGVKNIYHWYADKNEDTKGTEITNMYHVKFADRCWRMIRTTDIGGVRLLYNGEYDENLKCTDGRGHIKEIVYDYGYLYYDYSNDYYYGTDYIYDPETGKFTLSGEITHGSVNNDNYQEFLGKYTCEYSNQNSCTTLYKTLFRIGNNQLYCIQLYKSNYHNSGYQSTIGYGAFNYGDVSSSLGASGYMYGDIYPTQTQTTSDSQYFGNEPDFIYRRAIENRYLVSDEIVEAQVSYSHSYPIYTLKNPRPITSYSNEELIGKYWIPYSGFTFSDKSDYRIADVDDNWNMYTLDHYYYKSNYDGTSTYIYYDYITIKVGDSITENDDGTFTINDVTEVSFSTFMKNKDRYIGKILCEDGTTTCKTPWKITRYYCYQCDTASGYASLDIYYKDASDEILIAKNRNGYQLLDTIIVSKTDLVNNYDNYKEYPYTCGNKSSLCTEDDLRIIYAVDNSSYRPAINTFQNLFYFGSDAIWDGEKYTLVDPQEFDILNDLDRMSNHHYFCLQKGAKSCEKVGFIVSFGGTSYYSSTLYYILFENGINDIEEIRRAMIEKNENSSYIKLNVDEWYSRNLTKYTDYLEDTVYCNNRKPLDENNGFYGKTKKINGEFRTFNLDTYSYTYDQLNLKCDNETDRFSVDNPKAKLTYPAALLTFQEISLLYNQNAKKVYDSFYTGTTSASMSGSSYIISTYYGSAYTSSWYPIVPAISLKEGTEYIEGDGSASNPYVVDTSEVDGQ